MKTTLKLLLFALMLGMTVPAVAQKKSKGTKATAYEYVSIVKYQTYRMEIKELEQMTMESDRFRRPGESISAQFGSSAFEYHIDVLTEEERNQFSEMAMSARTFTQLLNHLGDYGFAVCGHSSLSHEGGLEVHTYILKRPKK